MIKECIQVKAEDISKLLYEVYDVPSGICEQIKIMQQRLEEIDNANPSEAMKCLENIGFAPLNEVCGYPYTRIKDEYDEDFNIVKQTLLKSQEQEKVLKIIFEKNVDIHILEFSNTVEEYNQKIVKETDFGMELTDDEFKLVKEYRYTRG